VGFGKIVQTGTPEFFTFFFNLKKILLLWMSDQLIYILTDFTGSKINNHISL